MVGHAGSATCIVQAHITLTWFKVKVNDLLNFQKLHFSSSISSAILSWIAKLMVDYDSMGLMATAFRSQISEFLSQLAVT